MAGGPVCKKIRPVAQDEIKNKKWLVALYERKENISFQHERKRKDGRWPNMKEKEKICGLV